MPLLTINNLRTSVFEVQDPTGLYGTSISVPGSGSVTNKAISLAALAAIESLLVASATASNITWSVVDDPNSQSDNPPEHATTVLLTPYNAVAGDQDILTNLTTPGAVSVVLSAAAQVGRTVKVADLKGDAASNNVTITVAGGGTINGGANVVINTNKGWAFLLKVSATAWIAVLSTQISTSAAGGDLTGTYPNPTLNAMFFGAAATLSGAGTLSVAADTTLFTSTGAGNALVLPDGTRTGQTVTVIHSTKGASGTGVITPTHAGNFATATLTNHWDWAKFKWSGAYWDVIAAGTTGSIIA